MDHLRCFQDEYTEFRRIILAVTAESLENEITYHCKNPAIAEGPSPLLMQNRLNQPDQILRNHKLPRG